MRSKSLNFKLMIAFIGVIMFFSLISYSLLIKSFQQYYYEDIYKVLEDNNNKKKDKMYSNIDDFIESKEDIRSIEQMFWTMTNGRLARRPYKADEYSVTEEVLSEIEKNILHQKGESIRYELDVNGRRLFYVIDIYDTKKIIYGDIISKLDITQNKTKLTDEQRKKRIDDLLKRREAIKTTIYAVSLRWAPLDNTLEYQLYVQLGIVLVVTAIATLVVFFVLSKYLTRPLNQLTKSVKRISNRKFDMPITINRQDEIGFLASTIDEMRKDLLSYDEEQKLKLHSISHELKTPIMIIQSYADGLRRGMHPKGTPEASLQVIEDECNRLEKLVANLLYIQRLDYIDTEIKHKESINLQDPIHAVLDNMALKLNDFTMSIQMDHVYIIADYNQVKIIIENIMSNQIRYAKTAIRIALREENKKAILEIYNDGEAVDDLENIFKMFKKGKNGQSGLGLYIVKRLVHMSHGDIYAINEKDGVTFRLEWPVK